MSFSFVHIVNAVAESENKSLFELQKLTFASLQKFTEELQKIKNHDKILISSKLE